MTTSAEKDALVGYRRDRSFYASRPSGAYSPAVHRDSAAHPGMAACDTRLILLDTDHPVRLQDAPRLCLRCFPTSVTPPGGGRGADPA